MGQPHGGWFVDYLFLKLRNVGNRYGKAYGSMPKIVAIRRVFPNEEQESHFYRTSFVFPVTGLGFSLKEGLYSSYKIGFPSFG